MNKFLLLFFLPILLTAQIPNAGFENWTDSQPDGWATSNVPDFVIPVSQTNDSHSGNYAIKGEVVPISTIVYLPTIQVNNGDNIYFDVDQKYTSLNGYFKFTSQNADEIFFGGLSVTDAEANTVIGVGYIELSQNSSDFIPFSMEIEYFTDATPGKMSLYFSISADSLPKPGTNYILDDLSLSTVTGLEKHLQQNPETFALQQNYPNPFNPTTKINYQLTEAGHTKLIVYDCNGEEVQTLINSNLSAGNYSISFNGSSLPSGVYFYRLTSGGFNATKRMLLIK